MDYGHFFFFNRVFELPLLTNAQNLTLKKTKKTYVLGLVSSSKVDQTYDEVRQNVFECTSLRLSQLNARYLVFT
jgi:hypothetical protein